MKTKIRFTDANFEEEVLDSTLPVLVDFWSSWCPPCQMVEPLIDALAMELEGKVKVGKLQVDQNRGTSAKFQVTGVPMFLFFKDGKVQRREVGAHSKGQLLKMIKEVFEI